MDLVVVVVVVAALLAERPRAATRKAAGAGRPTGGRDPRRSMRRAAHPKPKRAVYAIVDAQSTRGRQLRTRLDLPDHFII